MEELEDEWGLLDEPRTREVRRKVQHNLEDDDDHTRLNIKLQILTPQKILLDGPRTREVRRKVQHPFSKLPRR